MQLTISSFGFTGKNRQLYTFYCYDKETKGDVLSILGTYYNGVCFYKILQAMKEPIIDCCQIAKDGVSFVDSEKQNHNDIAECLCNYILESNGLEGYFDELSVVN